MSRGTLNRLARQLLLATVLFSVGCASESFIQSDDDSRIDRQSNIPPANHSPNVNAGSDLSVVANTAVRLTGSATDDGLPDPPGLLSTIWSQQSGPALVALTAPDELQTDVVFPVAGTYEMALTADDGDISKQDLVTVIVSASGGSHNPPIVNAGADFTVTLSVAAPFNVVAPLNGTATDDGLPNSTLDITWSRVSGPAAVTFANANLPAASVTFTVAGSYVLRLSANDGELITFNDVNVTVNAANQAPVVNAGANFTANVNVAALLNGTATDDGLPNSTLDITWSRVSGPAAVTFANANLPATSATFTVAGNYVLRLEANDGALTNQDDVSVTVVNAGNQAPVVNAGGNFSAVVGTVTTLSGTASDDGLPNGTLTSTWSRVSGPATITFANANALITTTTFPLVGTYVLRLSVTDSLLTTQDDLTVTVTTGGSGSTGPRGYLTTPAELAFIKTQALANIEPYRAAAGNISSRSGGIFSHALAPTSWPSSVTSGISGSQSCSGTKQPGYIFFGGQVAYAKAIAWHFTGDIVYAQQVKAKILDLIDTTGFGGESYSGGNQCILNLSWYMPSWISAADLIEGQMTAAEKRSFQTWLATEVYKKVEWASESRANNWGTAASATAASIADYLSASSIDLVDRHGNTMGARAAYDLAKQRQIDRLVGNGYMDYNCAAQVGMRSDGGLPEELRRGSTGCTGPYIVSTDSSHSYSCTSMQGYSVHAELLKRRGDLTLYNYSGVLGNPLLKSILFVIANPNDLAHSYDFTSSSMSVLELGLRHYQNASIATSLGIGGGRTITGVSGQMLHYGTLTHGFAAGGSPQVTPTTALPVD